MEAALHGFPDASFSPGVMFQGFVSLQGTGQMSSFLLLNKTHLSATGTA